SLLLRRRFPDRRAAISHFHGRRRAEAEQGEPRLRNRRMGRRSGGPTRRRTHGAGGRNRSSYTRRDGSRPRLETACCGERRLKERKGTRGLRLSELSEGRNETVGLGRDIEVTGLTADSRMVQPGFLFA